MKARNIILATLWIAVAALSAFAVSVLALASTLMLNQEYTDAEFGNDIAEFIQ